MRDILFIRGVKNVNSSLGDNECIKYFGPHYRAMIKSKAYESHVTNKKYTESFDKIYSI